MGYLSEVTSQLKKEQSIIIVGTGLILIDESNRVLMACRTDNNQWSIPGGSLEVGESLQECIVRETKEETGIEVDINELHFNSVNALNETVYKNGRQLNIVSVTYWADKFNSDEFKIEDREFSTYKWISLADVEELYNVTTYTKVAIDEFISRRVR